MRTSFIIIAALVISGLATMFLAERSYSNKLEQAATLAQPSPEAVSMLNAETLPSDTTANVPEN
jgi:hypothetical protein